MFAFCRHRPRKTCSTVSVLASSHSLHTALLTSQLTSPPRFRCPSIPSSRPWLAPNLRAPMIPWLGQPQRYNRAAMELQGSRRPNLKLLAPRDGVRSTSALPLPLCPRRWCFSRGTPVRFSRLHSGPSQGKCCMRRYQGSYHSCNCPDRPLDRHRALEQHRQLVARCPSSRSPRLQLVVGGLGK